MAIKLIATHKPTGETEEFGPIEVPADPQEALALSSYAHGFVHGLFTKRHGAGFDPEDLDVQVVAVSDANSVVGQLVAEASATVTRADGTVT